MLDELQRAISRLEPGLPHGEELSLLYREHLSLLERLRDAQKPQIVRILAEDVAESLDWIPSLLTKEQWVRYAHAAKTGIIVGPEFERFSRARNTVHCILRRSYLDDYDWQKGYKHQRYEYALFSTPVPAWFQAEKAPDWLEEATTAYCFAYFVAADYDYESKKEVQYCG